MRHFLVMTLFAALASIVFGAMTKDNAHERLLYGVKVFAEPCCGDGDLVRHLEAHGLRCTYAGDIRTGQDALAIDTYGDT